MSETTQTTTQTQAPADNSAQLKTLQEQLSAHQAQIRALEQDKAALSAARQADSDRLATQLARSAVRFEAAQQGILNTGLADVLPIDGAKVDHATGTVSGTQEVIAAWRTKFPEVFRSGNTQTVPTTQPVTQTQAPVTQTTQPVTQGTPVQTFGPGATNVTDSPAPVLDARTMSKADAAKAKAELFRAAAKADAVSHNNAALSLTH